MAATDDKKSDREPFTSAHRKRLTLDLAKLMQSKEWTDGSHKDHIATVTKVFNLYCKRHGTK